MNGNLILENLRCSVIKIDRNLVIETVNLAAETLFCKSRRYLIGTQFCDLIPSKELYQRITDCLSNDTQYTLREVAINLPDSETLVDITLSSCIGVNQSNTQDQTSSVLIEINSINRISRFMQEKNQMKRQRSFRLMMRGLAHEIKNPLGGIRGAAQLLDREIVDPSRKELTNILIKEADRLTRLVDRVMGSRNQLKLHSLNIHEVLEHVIHLINVNSADPIRIERIYDPALPEIVADKEQLIQAVLNIVGNALEVQKDSETPKIGFITQFERFVTLNSDLFRQVMKIQIWDDGPGVAEDIKEILFDPLITSRPEGTGLGLSITQEIMQNHKGVVQLEGYQGKTCFSLYLPYIEPKITEDK